MCTAVIINGIDVDTIGGVKSLSPTLYDLVISHVNDPWDDRDCLCTVDMDVLIKHNPLLSIKDVSDSTERKYSLTTVESDPQEAVC